MRRLAAHLALAAIYVGFFSPLLAAEESTLHACCLRKGAHHCQGTSSEAGFHAARTACPYSTELPPAAPFGLEPETFGMRPGAARGLRVSHCLDSYATPSASGLSARAPPVFFL